MTLDRPSVACRANMLGKGSRHCTLQRHTQCTRCVQRSAASRSGTADKSRRQLRYTTHRAQLCSWCSRLRLMGRSARYQGRSSSILSRRTSMCPHMDHSQCAVDSALGPMHIAHMANRLRCTRKSRLDSHNSRTPSSRHSAAYRPRSSCTCRPSRRCVRHSRKSSCDNLSYPIKAPCQDRSSCTPLRPDYTGCCR